MNRNATDNYFNARGNPVNNNGYMNDGTANEYMQNSRVNRLPRKCLDYVSLDEVTIASHVGQSSDNLVLIDSTGRTAACASRSQIRESIKDPTAVFYPCVRRPDNRGLAANFSAPLIKVSVGSNYFVPFDDVRRLAHPSTKAQVYMVLPTTTRHERTTSKRAARLIGEAAWVSADHCQEGTAKTVHRLVPVST